MKIKVEDKEIIENGVILLNSSQKLEFEFDEFALRFIVNFEKSHEKKEPHIKTEINTSKDYLSINLFNFENTQNVGYDILLPLAHIKGKALSLKFRITTIDTDQNPDIIFNYSWYLDINPAEDG